MVVGGEIDTIGSDHSPAPPDLKHLVAGDLAKAWGGIASLQLLLPAVWTAVGDICPPTRVVRAMTAAPARLVGFAGRKGAIAPGLDADFVVFNPHREFAVASERLYHRHRTTPYLGYPFRGVVERTFLRGRMVYEWGEICGRPGGSMRKRFRP
jgi:allantoinase